MLHHTQKYISFEYFFSRMINIYIFSIYFAYLSDLNLICVIPWPFVWSITPEKMCIHTLSLCIPPALSIFITNINDTALGRYSMSFGVTSPVPPMPGVSTRIAFPYGSYRNISLLCFHAKQ